jgi:hypothetical protein
VTVGPMYFLKKSMENGTVIKKISNFSNFLSSQAVINPLRLSYFQQNRLKKMACHQPPGIL